MPALQTAKEYRAEVRKLTERMEEILDSPDGENGDLSGDQEATFDELHEKQERLLEEAAEIEEREEQKRQRQEAVKSAKDWLKTSDGVSRAAQLDTEEIDGAGSNGEEAEESEEGQAYQRAFENYLRYGVAGLEPEERPSPGHRASRQTSAVASSSPRG